MTLEKLLNILCEKGWKPRGENAMPNSYWVEGNSICWNRGGKASIRELVSKDSGLWQFCEENGMITNWNRRIKNDFPLQADEGEDACVYNGCYECKIIESALCDEDKLEQFLLDNIKVEG